jgi:uncharacterized protein (DUF2141 family)
MLKRIIRIAAGGLAILAVGLSGAAVPAHAQYAEKISNDPSRCEGPGPAVRVNVTGIKSARGNMRVQIYRALRSDWLEKDRWMYRIEAPARQGSMVFCLPVPRAGSYAIAIRHDANDNDDTDIFADGGGMSNNPSVNIFNLGRPSHTRTAFEVGNAVRSIDIRMRYF